MSGVATSPKAAGKRAGIVPSQADYTIIRAPQELIHIKHNVTILQYKYWLILFSDMAEQMRSGVEADAMGFFHMPMAKLADRVGYTPRKSVLWDDLNTLKNQTLAFNFLTKDKTSVKYGAGYVSEWFVSNDWVKYKFPSVLYLAAKGIGFNVHKSIFLLLNWDIFNHFSGKYEAIIYKLCKDYADVINTPYMSIPDFREYMGIGPDEYANFKDFNKWCIKKPVDAINRSDISDITVTQEIRRDGRNAVGIYFKVTLKKQTSLFQDEFENPFKFAKVPIPPQKQRKYMSLQLAENIAICLQRANEWGEELEKKGKKADYGGIYYKAITEGWHEDVAERNKKIAEEQAKRDAAKQKEDAKKAKKEADDNARQEERNVLLSAFGSLPTERQERLRDEFAATLTYAAEAKGWGKDRASGGKPEELAKFRAKFCQFLKDEKRIDIE